MSATVLKLPSKEKAEKIDNTELLTTFNAAGGRIYHHRPGTHGRRGITFAFRVKGGRVEVATAVQHVNDTFTKKVGTRTAIEHFNAGKTIFLPLRPARPDRSRIRQFHIALTMLATYL